MFLRSFPKKVGAICSKQFPVEGGIVEDTNSALLTPPPMKKRHFQTFRKEYLQLVHIVNMTFLSL